MDEDFYISLQQLVQEGKLDPATAYELIERLKNELDDLARILNRRIRKIARQMKLEELD